MNYNKVQFGSAEITKGKALPGPSKGAALAWKFLVPTLTSVDSITLNVASLVGVRKGMCLSYRSGSCKTALWLFGAAVWFAGVPGAAAQPANEQVQVQQPYTESLFTGGMAETRQEYTVLYVNPSAGRDDTGTGATSAPFRTITHALSVAEPNTVIALTPGTYSEASGETFPLQLKSNVTIQGSRNSRGQNIIIQGGGLFMSPTFARQNVTLLGADQAGLMGVTVINPNPRGYGLWVESTSPVVLDNTFRGSTHDGISVTGDGRPVVQNNHFIQNGASGISFFGRSQGQVENNVFENTGFGVNIAQNATPLIANNRIVENRVGVVVQANARPVLRNNVIEANREDGLTAIANGLPDLGTATQPGGNIFRNNGRLDINAEAAKQLIPVYGSQFASEATRGSLDLAGNPIAPPPPEEPPRATLVAAARSAAANRANPPRAATPSAAQTGSISAQSFPVPSSLQSTRPQPEATRGSAIAIPPTAPSSALPSPPQPQSQTRPVVETRAIETSDNPAILQPPGQLSVQPQPALAQPNTATEVPVSQPPQSTGSVSDLLARSPVEASTPTLPQVAAPTAPEAQETPATRAEQMLADRRSRRQTTPQPQGNAIAVPTPDAPIPIPVSPPPQGSASSSPSQPALSLPGGILPVPSAPIPVGSGSGGLPSVTISRAASSEGPPPPPSRAGILGLRYRVIVEARTEAEQNQVRSLIPDAFRTQYQGQVLMQAGAYRDRTEADNMIELLTRNGFKTILQESD